MNILINASNIRLGGGLQVADSISRQLPFFNDKHHYFVILASALKQTLNFLQNYPNIKAIEYDLPFSLSTILTGNDVFLDNIVKKEKIDAVLTVFGPSRWRPKVKHLTGFALAQLVLSESPYWKVISKKDFFKQKLRNVLMNLDFKKKNDFIWTENEYISEKVREKYKGKNIITVTNNYNQIFDKPEEWDKSIVLPQFDGTTFLTVSTNYPHKNLKIALEALNELEKIDYNQKIRFVFTINKDEYPEVPEKFKENFIFTGAVSIDKVPFLYEQADIMFQPTLLECFTATYTEAMRMERPILTTDLGFARGLCGEAALFYAPLDAKDLAQKIAEISKNNILRDSLIKKGKEEIKKFDTYSQRAHKLISFLESETNIQNRVNKS